MRPPLLQMPIANRRSPGWSQFLSNWAANRRFPWPPSVRFICQNSSHKSGKHLTYFHQFIKGYDRTYRWTSKWRDSQGKDWESPPSTGASVPMCSKPNTVGILWQLHHVDRHNQLLTSLLAFLLSEEKGGTGGIVKMEQGRGWKNQASKCGSVFPVTSSDPEAHPESLH